MSVFKRKVTIPLANLEKVKTWIRSILIKHFQNYLCDDKELPSSYGFSGSVPSDESGTITEAPTIFRPILETDSYLE